MFFKNNFQSDIYDVNQIFKDLGMLVHEQGEVIGKNESLHIVVAIFKTIYQI